MSIALLELAADALGALVADVTFVGGATLTLWIDDPAAPTPRPTLDVDVVCDVATRAGYYAFGERLSTQGFTVAMDEPITCRWRHAASPLVLDVMPTDPDVLGFTNAWYVSGIHTAVTRRLPSGRVISVFDPPHLVATKLAAWSGRGRDDLLASADAADVLSLVNGRSSLTDEIAAAPAELRGFVSAGTDGLLRHHDIDYAILDAVRYYGPAQAEREQVVRERLVRIAAIA